MLGKQDSDSNWKKKRNLKRLGQQLDRKKTAYTKNYQFALETSINVFAILSRLDVIVDLQGRTCQYSNRNWGVAIKGPLKEIL